MDFEDIIKDIKGLPAAIPSNNFTDSVMGRIGHRGLISNLRKALLRKHQASFKMKTIFWRELEFQDSSYVLLNTAIFYLITGITLISGCKLFNLQGFDQWFMLQALISFLSMGYFCTAWVYCKANQNHFRPALKIGSIIYLIFISIYILQGALSNLPFPIFSILLGSVGMLISCLFLLNGTRFAAGIWAFQP